MSFSKYTGIGGAGGITVYPNAAAFPASATDGEQAVAADTNTIYIYDSGVPGWVPVATPPVGVYISDLTGDVTATGPGSAAATVDFVGGETAADVATSVQDTQAATDLSTASTLVKRDASSKTALKGLKLDGSVSGTLTIDPAATVTTYSVTLPAAQGAASSVLQNDGAGVLSWSVLPTPVTSVGGTAPIASSGGTTPTISISQSSAMSDGYLSSTDWSTFNSKQNALTTGNLSEVTSSVLTITGGTGCVIGSGTTIQVDQAGAATDGYLSSADWNTFNNKQPAGTYVTSVGATAPVASTGGTTPTISMSQSSALADGYLSSADWSTFNSKQNALTIGNLTGDNNANISISSGTGAVIGTGTSISQTAASAISNGYLTSADWSTFNSKQPAGTYVTSVGATSPVASSGGTTPTISMPVATALADGYLSSADWSTFNSKMTNPMNAAGDIIVGGVAGAPTKLAIGAVDKVLVSDGTTLTYQYAGLGGGAFASGTVVLGRAQPAGLTGIQNILLGTTAGNALSTGANNILIGTGSGLVNATVPNNVGIGTSALAALTSGAGGAVAIGYQAGLAVTTAPIGGGGPPGSAPPVYIGYQSGALQTSGSNCVFVGPFTGGQSGISAAGIHYTAVGARAGGGSGTSNVAMGTETMQNSTGSDNTGIGYRCLAATSASGVSGSRNTSLGSGSGNGNTSGADNVYLGYQSGAFASAGGLNSNGTSNTLIGVQTTTLATNSTSAISLGRQAVAASNEMAVGSASYQINTMLLGRGGASQTVANAVTLMTMRASGSTDTSMTVGTLTLGGAQGTGTGAGGDVIIATAPAAGVSGSTTNAHVERIRAKSATEVVVNDTGVDFDFRVEGDADANLLFVDAGTDRVGIGLNNPSVKFEVSGDSSLNGALVVNESGADKDTRIEGDTDVNLVFVDASTDRVGIGTATPAEKLDVGTGNLRVSNGNLLLNTAGNGINIKEGTNARIGVTGAFPGGNPNTVTVSTTAVTSNSIVFVSAVSFTGGITGAPYISAITANTSFVITVPDNSFTGTVGWMIVDRIP